MSPGALLAIFALQLAALLAPLALGVVGLFSGGTAGFASIAAWFLVGIPLSYAVVDRRTGRRALDSDAPGLGPARSAMPRPWSRPQSAPATRLRVEHVLRS